MRKIAVINQKGGCGKTTTAVNLSACLAELGRQVLLVDLDPQGHGSLGLGVMPEDLRIGMYSVLAQEASLPEVLHPIRPRLDLAPSNITLAAIEQKLAGTEQREWRLLQALSELNLFYDFVLMDCPPSLGMLTVNALVACQEVLIPLEIGAFSVHGVDRLLETVELVKKRCQKPIKVMILVTLFEGRTNHSKLMLSRITEVFGEQVLKTVIRQTVRLREAAREGLPVTEYARSSKGYEDHSALAKELLAGPESVPLPKTGEQELLKTLEKV